MKKSLTIIILAAGQSKRMKSHTSKVLHKLAGVPLLERVVKTAQQLHPENIIIVYGNHDETLPEKMAYLNCQWVEQKQQLGTGHAVQQALPLVKTEQTLILYGDVPLIKVETLQALLAASDQQSLGILTTLRINPTGYGRIVRDAQQQVIAIVEQKDTTPSQQQIKEINTGIITAPTSQLSQWLPQLKNQNAQGEYYLTDIIAMAAQQGSTLVTVTTDSEEESQGINDRLELARLERYLQQQQAQQLMAQGVTIMDPSRLDIRGNLIAAKDVTLDVNVIIEGNVTIGSHSKIGPQVYLRDVVIGENVEIKANSVIEEAIIKNHCTIGPFARVRPGTELADHVHVGNFVEIKKSQIAAGSKLPHLSYIGDAIIGQDVNVGAGVITCNYNGVTKSITTIKDGAFIGSDSQLVAPVTIGENAYIGSGSTITKDAPPNELTLARAKQTTISGWKKPQKDKS